MNILKYILIERKKHRKLVNYLLLFIPLIMEIYMLTSKPVKMLPSDGWLMQFYYVPVLNAIFFPVIIAVISSRYVDVEHKGNTFKSIYTFAKPTEIFYSKMLYIILHLIELCILQTIVLLITGNFMKYTNTPNPQDCIFFCISNILVCVVLCWFQTILSYFFSNQALSICIGLAGSLAGLFLLYLPQGIIQRILPWGLCGYSIFSMMEWNEATRLCTFYHTGYNFHFFVMIAVWLLIFIVVTHFLLVKQDTENDAIKEHENKHITKVTFHQIPIELMKLKASPAWYAFILLPIISTTIGTFNYKVNIEILTTEWYSLWSQHTLFLSYFFMPSVIGIFLSSIWRLEHNGSNWNQLMVNVKPWKLIMSKYITAVFITCMSLLWTALLFVVCGKYVGITSELPKELPEWIICGCIGAASVCAIQCFLSLWIHNFVIPIGIAFIGGLVGLSLTANEKPYILPYSLMSIGFRSNNPEFVIDMPRFLIGCSINIVIWLMLCLIYLKISDVKTHE